MLYSNFFLVHSIYSAFVISTLNSIYEIDICKIKQKKQLVSVDKQTVCSLSGLKPEDRCNGDDVHLKKAAQLVDR